MFASPPQMVDLVVISRFPHLVLVSRSQDGVLGLAPSLPPPGDPGLWVIRRRATEQEEVGEGLL